MNRTQCRSSSGEFLVDSLLIVGGERSTGVPFEGCLVGAYCIERELLSWRSLRFPEGVEAGDLVVFPSTAGYLMHILEGASHQIPLARNLIIGRGSLSSTRSISRRRPESLRWRPWPPRRTVSV